MRVLVLVLLGFAAVAIPAYVAFNWAVNSALLQLGTLFAEKQVLYDRYRGLEALMREVTLAGALAGSQSVRDWANAEDDPVLRRRGIAELEHFRQSFADQSYFFVVGSSGKYYFNDAANSYADNQYRYTVNADNPRDQWYFSTAALGEGCYLNVDNDANLRVTKVWINCVIREGRRVLGVLGTGIDLSSFVDEVVNVPQVGVVSMFVDRNGAVQAHRDRDKIDLRSLTSEMSAKRSVFHMVDKPEDQAGLKALMDQVAGGGVLADSRFMNIEGKETLVGVGYLDKLGWFNVTLMDIDSIIDRRLFLPIGLLLAAVMGLVSVMLVLVFNRQVLDRLRRLEVVVHAARNGDYGPALAMGEDRQDEVGRLSSALTEMAVAVSDNTRLLEARVAERTEELAQLAFRDGQTGIANRRGIVAAFDQVRPGQRRGVLLVDIDHFKGINDTYGHSAGDAVIAEVASRIGQFIGNTGICARWGGDEFLVLLNESAPNTLRQSAEDLLIAVCDRPIAVSDRKSVTVTVSIGACLAVSTDTIEVATEMADAALYMAKNEGRHRICVLDQDTAHVGVA